MRRYTITLGASTTAGGKVIAASANGSINGVKIALENDPIFCPACKSQGKILCVGPRIPETWNGKQVALEHDLCMCGCPVPPKLVPNQSLRSQTVEDSPSQVRPQANPADVALGEPVNSQTGPSKYDLFFVIEDRTTGRPLAGIPYKITLESGRESIGTSDSQGRSQLVSSDTPEIATLEAPYYDQDRAQTYSGCGSDACDC